MFEQLKKLVKNFGKKKRPPRPQVIKMYVLCRMDLAPIHRAVQGGHAVAEFFLRYGSDSNARTLINRDGKALEWRNGYMIYLGVKDEYELALYQNRLIKHEVYHAAFLEPDWRSTPELTAVACVSFGKEFRDLPLLSMDSFEPVEVFSKEAVENCEKGQ